MAFLPILAFALAAAQSPVGDVPSKYKTAAPTPDTVVARVNGIAIKAGEVEPFLWQWRGNDAIQDFVTYQVLKTEAEKDRIDVSDAEVEKQIDLDIQQLQKQLPPNTDLSNVQATLAAQGITRSRLFVRARTQVLAEKIVQRSFSPKNIVNISTISFHAASEQTAALSDAIKRADAAYDRLKKGENWDAVLTSTTTDRTIIQSKGLVGWRDLSLFPKSVAEELKTLKPGEITKPAQTTGAIQIFRLNAFGETAKGKDLEDLKQYYFGAAYSQLIQRLHDEAKIERFFPAVPSLNGQKDGN